MRSSRFSSSKSHSSKYQLKPSVTCPIKSSNVVKLSSKNKKNVCFSSAFVMQGQLTEIQLINQQECKYFLKQSAADFFQNIDNTQRIILIGCLGSNKLINHFIWQMVECKQEQIDFRGEETVQGIQLYNFYLRRNNECIVFIKLACTNTQDVYQKYFTIFIHIISYLIIFVDDKIPQNYLQQIPIKVKEQQCFVRQSPQFTCHLIFQQKIKIEQDLLFQYENLFAGVVLSSLKVGSKSNKDNKVRQIREYLISSEIFYEQQPYIYPKYSRIILQSLLGAVWETGWPNRRQMLMKKIYEHKLTKSKIKYQQLLDSNTLLQLQSYNSLIELLAQFSHQIISSFNSQTLDSHQHQQTFEQLLSFIQSSQHHTLSNYQLQTCEQIFTEYSSNTQLEDTVEVDSPQTLLAQLAKINTKYDHQQADNLHVSITQKLMILARAGARFNIFGYDQKQKIIDLRQQIDHSWNLLKLAEDQRNLRQAQPTEANLLKIKFELLDSKIRDLEAKKDFLSEQVHLVKYADILIDPVIGKKNEEYNEMVKNTARNKNLLEYLRSTSIQTPEGGLARKKIQIVLLKMKELSQKKQQILDTLTSTRDLKL